MDESPGRNIQEQAQLNKVLSDPNRLLIVDMLSHGELCACVILEKLHITQPTLSHHMGILCDSGLVVGRKHGKWTYYSLRGETLRELREFWENIASVHESNKEVTSCEEDCCS